MTYTLLKNPVFNTFFEMVESTKESLFLCSPFIKNEITEHLIKKNPKNVKVDILTSFKLANFYRRSSDLEALRNFVQNNMTVKNLTSLHAKVYIFDKQKTIITSANLTNNGLRNNYEYGILINDPIQTQKVFEEFSTVFNSEDVSIVTKNILDETDAILEKIPRYKPVKFDVADDDLFDAGTQYIEPSLAGWTLDIFRVLKEVSSETFSLNDVYKFRSHIQNLHPQNHHIDDKIRQQLQVLRDRGLVEFLGKGNYRKLWKDSIGNS